MIALCLASSTRLANPTNGAEIAARSERAGQGALALTIAGGGTGGHLFPGIAVAQLLRAQEPTSRILFISVGNPLECRTLERYGFELCRVPVEGIAGRGLWRQLRAALRLPAALVSAMGILLRHRPQVVLGVGGYASGPVVLAAWLMGIPIAIHEQNSAAGLTNRWLAKIARRVLCSFPDTACGAAQRLRVTGNPVRSEIAALAGQPYAAPFERPLRILVLGGSQGAHALNLAVIAALPELAQGPAVQWVHQTGTQDAAMVSAAYRKHGVEATVQPFFDDMPERYHWCDLVLCRSGASTIFELGAVGRAAILVPFPFAAGDHQHLNAQWLVAGGAAERVLEKELSGAELARRIATLAADPSRLSAMAAAAARCGRPNAAADILAACRELACGKEQ